MEAPARKCLAEAAEVARRVAGFAGVVKVAREVAGVVEGVEEAPLRYRCC